MKKNLDVISGVMFCLSLLMIFIIVGVIDADIIDFKKCILLSVAAVVFMLLSLGIAYREDV